MHGRTRTLAGVSHTGTFVNGKGIGQGVGVWPLPDRLLLRAERLQTRQPPPTAAISVMAARADSLSENDMMLEDETSDSSKIYEEEVWMTDEVPGIRLDTSVDKTKGAQRELETGAHLQHKCREGLRAVERHKPWGRYCTFRFKGLWKEDKLVQKGSLA